MSSTPRYCGICYNSGSTSRPRPSWLPQVSLSTLCKIQDIASSTSLTQTFINPSQTAIAKAKYTFPLYESCAVVSFRCYVGGRLIEGVVKEKGQAKADYMEAVERGQTAGLLEQHSPDVFSTNLGNIPASETVKVEIEYLIELKHNAEIDGLRFTIPTTIAPRYGDAPSGMNVSDIPGAIGRGGMKISVQLTMPSNIRSVYSPSHNIAMHLGGHVKNIPDDAFDPKHALATLSQPATVLAKDFVLLVKCSDLSVPRALLETHPTIPNSKALMITLVPKFTLPPGVKPEIVFVVDRSGSMDHRMKPLKSSLRVFLKSLPVDIKFNICSFGSEHSFLWRKSKSYSAKSLEEAIRHVQGMNADFGGTQILPAIKSTVSRRYVDLPLEIMMLTDGEVWNTEELFEYVQQSTEKGDVRLFSLGIGQDVSHALVEGLARVGKGFAQIVSDEKEEMEGRVVRMLRGALSTHVNDYRLEWEGKLSEVDAKRKSSLAIGTPVDKLKKTISLYDTAAETEAPISFSGLPEFVVPSVLQAPYNLPPLFPFSRSTFYAILSGDGPTPSSLWLRGTTPSGDQLSLEIPVQDVPEKGETIHKLASRKILQELEEGTGYIHGGKYGIDRELEPGTFDEWVQREGVRVGVKYGLASKWTSFVAVQNKDTTNTGKNSDIDVDSTTELGDDELEVMVDSDCDMDSDSDEYVSKMATPSLRFVEFVDCQAEISSSSDTDGDFFILDDDEFEDISGNDGDGGSEDERGLSEIATPSIQGYVESKSSRLLPNSPTTSSLEKLGAPVKRKREIDNLMDERGSGVKRPHRARRQEEYQQDDILSLGVSQSAPGPVAIATRSPTPREWTMALIALQTFEGSFPLTQALAAVLGTTLTELEVKLPKFVPGLTGLNDDQRKSLWATVLVVEMLERKLMAERDVWVLVVEKARAWMLGLVGAGYADIERSELVEGIFGESRD